MSAKGLITGEDGITRCWWAGHDPFYQQYHDTEWGFPVRDEVRLFEKLILEGFQSGLSWITILRKRENFRAAFAGFDMEKIAAFGEADVARLLADAGIVRHRGKIESTINNAKRALVLRDEFGSLADYFWRYEPDKAARPSKMDYESLTSFTTTKESIAMSKDLKKRGFSFVGPTTCYAFMQAMGLVNDHLEGCAIREKAEAARG